jgi:hypothetical protein
MSRSLSFWSRILTSFGLIDRKQGSVSNRQSYANLVPGTPYIIVDFVGDL